MGIEPRIHRTISLMPEWSLPAWQAFSPLCTSQPSCASGTTFSTALENLFKRRNQQKAQYMKNVALSRPWKGYLFTVWELKQGRGFPYWPQQGDRFTNTKTVNEHCVFATEPYALVVDIVTLHASILPPKTKDILHNHNSGNLTLVQYYLIEHSCSLFYLSQSCPFWQWFFQSRIRALHWVGTASLCPCDIDVFEVSRSVVCRMLPQSGFSDILWLLQSSCAFWQQYLSPFCGWQNWCPKRLSNWPEFEPGKSGPEPGRAFTCTESGFA